jgi:transcriptional regulator with XRE-family HTH domain
MDLRILRKAAGLTQRQLADRAGVDGSFISHIEAGDRAIGRCEYYTVVRLVRALVDDDTPIEKVFPVPALPDRHPVSSSQP